MRYFIALLGVLTLTAGAAFGQSHCAPDRLDIRSGTVSVRFTVEVADTPVLRAQGLMNRPGLGRFNGMIFVYSAPHPVSFWMRNTLIPLDMLFLDARGVVVRVHENATPLEEVAIFGGTDIQYVFEINGGMARKLGIAPGAMVRHPSINGANVIWPCE